MIAKMVYVRLKVTIFLFLRPNNRAKSRSTIMAVNVDRHSLLHRLREIMSNDKDSNVREPQTFNR